MSVFLSDYSLKSHTAFYWPCTPHSQRSSENYSSVPHEWVNAAFSCASSRQWAFSSKNKYLVEMPNPLSSTHRALSNKAGWNNASIARYNPQCPRGVAGHTNANEHTHKQRQVIMCGTSEQMSSTISLWVDKGWDVFVFGPKVWLDWTALMI